MTADEAIAIVRSKSRGRTRFEGQEPYLDEVLVAEIERLREYFDAAMAYRDATTGVSSQLSNAAALDRLTRAETEVHLGRKR